MSDTSVIFMTVAAGRGGSGPGCGSSTVPETDPGQDVFLMLLVIMLGGLKLVKTSRRDSTPSL